MKTIFKSILILTSAVLAACGGSEKKVAAEEPPATTSKAEEWLILFDGTSTEGWRGYNMDSLPANWVIADGALKSLGQGGDIGGDIVYGATEFDNFELSLEWKISPGGNSGIFYHVLEGEQYKAPYENAPEYQVLDDIGFPTPLEAWQKLGADYAMYPADTTQKVVKPAGTWNTSRILFTEDLAQYWLNGKKVVEFDPWSEDWLARRNSGKWDQYPDYGKAKSGLIGLQDHGSEIWFKNIKIKRL